MLHKNKKNTSRSASLIAKELKLNPRTCKKVIKRFNETLTIKKKPDTGLSLGPKNRILARNVLGSFNTNPGLTIRDRAKKFNTSIFFCLKVGLKSRLKVYKAIERQNRTKKQGSLVKTRARKFHDEVLTKLGGCLKFDDETYVKCDFNQIVE